MRLVSVLVFSTYLGGSDTVIHTWADDYNDKVKLEVRDAEFTDAAESYATISNIAPTVNEIANVSIDPIEVGIEITPSAIFTDTGTLDTHTAVWYWDSANSNENKSNGTVAEENGSVTASGSHTYDTSGVYTIKLVVTDKDGDSGESTLDYYVVIYDPSGGFVTGGGWIDSPGGAYPADPDLTGKANFGFVSNWFNRLITYALSFPRKRESIRINRNKLAHLI